MRTAPNLQKRKEILLLVDFTIAIHSHTLMAFSNLQRKKPPSPKQDQCKPKKLNPFYLYTKEQNPVVDEVKGSRLL